MKTIDFTKPGGFPLTQDRLAYLQSAYSEVLSAIVKMGGSGPFIISGMVVSGGGTTVTDGWFYYNGDIIQFTGGSVVLSGIDVPLVQISSVGAPLTYNDGSTPVVLNNKLATISHGPAIADATHFPVSSLLPFGTGFGQNNRESSWNSLVVSTPIPDGGVTGTIFYKKDFTANTLHLRALLSANNAQNFAASPGALYYLMGVLPSGFLPGNNSYFTGHYFVANMIKDDLGIAWIKQFTCGINTLGQVSVNWIRPDAAIAGYGIQFNTIVPLD